MRKTKEDLFEDLSKCGRLYVSENHNVNGKRLFFKLSSYDKVEKKWGECIKLSSNQDGICENHIHIRMDAIKDYLCTIVDRYTIEFAIFLYDDPDCPIVIRGIRPVEDLNLVGCKNLQSKSTCKTE